METPDAQLLSQALFLTNNNQAELARELGFSRQYINNMVRGRPMTVEIREKIRDFVQRRAVSKQQESEELGLTGSQSTSAWQDPTVAA